MNALGGSSDVSYSRATAEDVKQGKAKTEGELQPHATPSSHGSQFKRIIAGALAGLASSGQAGTGPGQATRAAALGVGGGMALAQKNRDFQLKQANDTFDAQQKAVVAQAQVAHLNQLTTQAAWEMTRSKQTAAFQDADRENEFAAKVAQGGSNRDLGVARDINEVMQMHKDMPDLLKLQASGQIVSIPHIDPKTQAIDGNHFFMISPDWGASKLDKDGKFYQLVPPKKPGDAPTVEEHTVPAGTMTNREFLTTQMAENTKVMQFYSDAFKEKQANERTRMTQEGEDRRSAATNATHLDAARIVATGKDDKLIKTDAVKAAQQARPMVNLLDSAEDYYKKGKFDSAGDLALIVQSVRAMNPGTVRLPNKELELEIKRGTYGDQIKRWYDTKIASGTLPDQFRDELMGVLRRETEHTAQDAADNWTQAFGQSGTPLPHHLQRFKKAAPPAGTTNPANAPAPGATNAANPAPPPPAGAVSIVKDASGKVIGHIVAGADGSKKYVALQGGN